MRQCELVEITKLQAFALETMFKKFDVKEIIPRLNIIALDGEEMDIFPIDIIIPKSKDEFKDILYKLGYDFIKTGMIPVATTLVASTNNGVILLGRTIRGYITKATAQVEKQDDCVRLIHKFRLSRCHRECVLSRFFLGYLASRRDAQAQYN
jgi:hypothetical protein